MQPIPQKGLYFLKNFINSYKILMCRRVFSKRTNLGNIYLVNIYIIKRSSEKLNITWLTKKKGISCGICFYYK